MIYKYISRLANRQRRLIDRLARDKDYSGTEGKVIHFLFENQDRTVYQKQIESVFGLRASTAMQVIASLEQAGLIRRVPSKADGRYKEIVLTEKAGQYKQDVYSDMERLKEQITRGIDPGQLQLWVEITEKMVRNMEDEA